MSFRTRFLFSLKTFIFFFFFILHYPPIANANEFPLKPELSITPGELCSDSSQTRYEERISYCKRDVDFEFKHYIREEYDKRFGYSILEMEWSDFKIDHFIPLCAGGSNGEKNLWPQHVSIYEITDPIEHIACEKMNFNLLLQEEAVELIKKVKLNLDEADSVLRYLESL